MSITARASPVPDRAALVRQLVEARSVAIVGASARPGSVGAVALDQLLRGGHAGRVVPVNPRYDELGGLRCVPSLTELADPPDLAVLAVSDALLEDQLTVAASCGVRAAVAFGGYSAVASEDAKTPLTERLAAIATASGIALCGPNGMGFIDFARSLRVVGYYEPFTRKPGGVTLLSQSGSVFSALLHNNRDLEFDLAVSCGQEATLTVADYLRHALERDATRVVALFLETLRDGNGLVEALRLALERDVPVVALTVGRSSTAGELVRAHSGGLAGDDGVYEALFEAYGVARVRTLDEMTDTLELFAAGRNAGPGGLATVHDSGGERAHVADLVEEEGLRFAEIGPTTTARLAARLDPGLAPTNPLDAWGSGRDFETAYRDHLVTLHDDPDTAVLVFAVDLTTEGGEDLGYLRVVREVQAATDKPFVLLANLTSGLDREDAARVRRHGVPVLEGTGSGLAAIRHLLERRDRLARQRPEPATRPDPQLTAAWRHRLARADAPLGEADGLALLRDFGVPVVPHRVAGSLDAALRAAEEIGWPVALKTAAAGVAHKSDVDGVRLGLTGPAELRVAYDDLAVRLGPDVLVARMVGAGTELALGLVRDPQIGSVVVVAAGGTLVEVLRDRVLALPPVDTDHARRLLDRLRLRPLLDGVRGRVGSDLASVTDAIVALSVLAEELGDVVTGLDVNPLIAGPDGCVAVDALVLPARPIKAVTAGALPPPA